jgi:hypothetical protein
MQHPDEDTCNIHLKSRQNIGDWCLQHTCTTITTYATSWSTFATTVWNTCDIPLKHLKHLNYTLATYIVSHCDLLRRLHCGATTVVGGEAGGLQRNAINTHRSVMFFLRKWILWYNLINRWRVWSTNYNKSRMIPLQRMNTFTFFCLVCIAHNHLYLTDQISLVTTS